MLEQAVPEQDKILQNGCLSPEDNYGRFTAEVVRDGTRQAVTLPQNCCVFFPLTATKQVNKAGCNMWTARENGRYSLDLLKIFAQLGTAKENNG